MTDVAVLIAVCTWVVLILVWSVVQHRHTDWLYDYRKQVMERWFANDMAKMGEYYESARRSSGPIGIYESGGEWDDGLADPDRLWWQIWKWDERHQWKQSA